jgi:hypothetical protein
MSAHSLPRRSATGRSGRHVPTLGLGVRAWLRSGTLDRHLAAGVPNWRTPLHARRALQLTARRQQRWLAKGLDRTLDEARRPPSGIGRIAVILPCRASVRHSADLIENLSATLHGDEPLHAMWVARLRLLLRDGTGPLYIAGRSDELHHRLSEVAEHILVED